MSRVASGGPENDDSGGVPWLRYIASAVCYIGVQSTEAAWFLTPQEYWALYDMKMEMDKPPVDYTPLDAAVELEQDLRRRGIIKDE